MVVYHSLGKTGWLTVVVNGTRHIPNGNFHGLLLFHFLNFFPEDRGCLLFTQKNRLVDSSKWDALNPPDVMMVRTKRIYILMNKVNKLFKQ